MFTRYKPSTHDLKKLSKRTASVEPRFLEVFPLGTEEDRERFELLRKAYVDARYNPKYAITREQLDWLSERVEHLRQVTKSLCGERIAKYEAQAEQDS